MKINLQTWPSSPNISIIWAIGAGILVRCVKWFCDCRNINISIINYHDERIHFLSFRTKILEQDESKDREKLVMKFIKIMKWLRKQNNFNSYLALLSALDSAPIRRLEWQRSITEGLKEYCALIDSSSSFRAYRQALSEST